VTGTNQPPDGDTASDPAELAGRERLAEQVVRTGMFGVSGTPDTSGYGGLKGRRPCPARGLTARTSTRSPTRSLARWSSLVRASGMP